jgi:hypothetical protein
MTDEAKILRIKHLINDVTQKRKEKQLEQLPMILKRVEGKRVRLTNEQKAEIAVYADNLKNAQLSSDDVISWAVQNLREARLI